MKRNLFSELFDFSDLTTLKCVTKLNEYEENKVLSKLFIKHANPLVDVQNSKLFKDRLGKSKVTSDIKKGDYKSIEIIKSNLDNIKELARKNNSKSTSKIIYWSNTIIGCLNAVVATGFPPLIVIAVVICSVEVSLFLANYISISLFGNKIINYTILDDIIDKKLLNSNTFKSIESFSKVNNKDLKEFANSDIEIINISENNSDNIYLNEINSLIEGKLSKTLLDLVVNSIRYPIYLIYHTRVSIDDYLQIQIEFLNLNQSRKDLDDSVKEKQKKWLDTFNKLSSIISVDFQKADKKALEDSKVKKVKYSDVSKEIPTELYNISF